MKKGIIKSYNYMTGCIEEINLYRYTKEIIELNYHYTSDLVFIDKIRENAKKLGYVYERNLNTSDYEESMSNIFPLYEKLTVFTKINIDKCSVFPNEKIAIYRSYSYIAEFHHYKTRELYIRSIYDNPVMEKKYIEFINLFCGEKGFNYDETYAINQINTILIVINDNVNNVIPKIFFKDHKNFVLFCLVSTSSNHQIFIGPDLRMNKDSDYQKKIDELKFLLGIDEKETNE